MYRGARLVVPGQLAGAVFKVQIDIGMGDATVPAPGMEEQTQRAFLRKSGAAEQAELGEVVRRLSGWLWPVLHQAAEFGAQAQDSNSESGH